MQKNESVYICGRDCFPGDQNCNGYCEGKEPHAKTYVREFKRENRYFVFKRKGMPLDAEDYMTKHLINTMGYIQYMPRPECLVIESDWPIYEEAWDMVKRLSQGDKQKSENLAGVINAIEAEVDSVWRFIEKQPPHAPEDDYLHGKHDALVDVLNKLKAGI